MLKNELFTLKLEKLGLKIELWSLGYISVIRLVNQNIWKLASCFDFQKYNLLENVFSIKNFNQIIMARPVTLND